MAHPVCGKCHSPNVYLDCDQEGTPVICCLMCGNRYPGAGPGFYMSDKGPLNDHQNSVEIKNMKAVSADEPLSESDKIFMETMTEFLRILSRAFL